MIDKYIRKQDAFDKIWTKADDFEQNYDILYAQGARAMAIVVEQMPPADVVQVVRCKDCTRYLDLRHWCKCHDTTMFENDFCSYGVREE